MGKSTGARAGACRFPGIETNQNGEGAPSGALAFYE